MEKGTVKNSRIASPSRFADFLLRNGAKKDEYEEIKESRIALANIRSLRATGLFQMAFGVFSFIYYLFISFNLVRF